MTIFRRLLLGTLALLALLSPARADWLWTRQLISGVGTIRTIAYGNGYFVAGTSAGYTLSSRDAVNWTIARPTTAAINDIAYGNRRFVGCIAASNGVKSKVIQSADGVGWSFARRASNNGLFGSLHGLSVVGSKNGRFISLGSDRTSLATSVNGTRWKNPLQGKAPAKYVGSVTGIATKGAFVICSSLAGVTIQTSPTGLEWTTRLSTSSRGPARGIAAQPSGRRLVCVGENGLCLTSANSGIDWDSHTFGSNDLLGVSAANGLFLSFSDRDVFSSSSGSTWARQLRAASGSDHLRAVAGGAGVYIAAGNNGKNGLLFVSYGQPGPSTPQ